jgi:hypothetical protein
MSQAEIIIIRANGDEEEHACSPDGALQLAKKLIDADWIDTIGFRDGSKRRMVVDDAGFEKKKPVNEKATALQREIHQRLVGKESPWCIVGDVAIISDEIEQ